MKQCCIDHNGKQKVKYSSKTEAKTIVKLKASEGIKLFIYPCQEGDGWHLTSHFIETSANTLTQDILEFSDKVLESYFLSKNIPIPKKNTQIKKVTKKYINNKNKINKKLLDILKKNKVISKKT